MMDCINTFVWYLLFVSYFCQATLSSRDKKSKKSKSTDIQEGPVDSSVFQRGLVSSNIVWKDIEIWSSAYHRNISKNSASKIILGYVTPWNSHGYDVAKMFGAKFTHISPVWLQLKVDKQKRKYVTTGQHDVDDGWMKAVRKAGRESNIKIVPRVIFENWDHQDFIDLIESQNKQRELAALLINLSQAKKFDGFVLEVWNQLPSIQIMQHMTRVISSLGRELRSKGLNAILVIPPPVYKHDQRGLFTKKEFDSLVDYFDGFSLMSYDYSNIQNPGPNSPLKWMEKCVKLLVPDSSSSHREKILMGMNLFGLDYTATGGSHTFGKQYLETVGKYKPKFLFDSESVEHFFEYKTKSGVHRVFYPTLYSLDARIKLAEELGVGISLWELGQGLDYFYDLF